MACLQKSLLFALIAILLLCLPTDMPLDGCFPLSGVAWLEGLILVWGVCKKDTSKKYVFQQHTYI